MTDRELMQMALNTLECVRTLIATSEKFNMQWYDIDINALRDRLAHPDLATVGEVGIWGELPDHNPNKGWVGLTDEEYVKEQQEAWNEVNVVDGFNTGEYSQVLWKRIEAKLKEKNT